MPPSASTDADGAGTPQEPVHIPVMAREALAQLDPRPGQVVVDATCGLLGHTRLLCERLDGDGMALGIDRDPEILERAREAARREGLEERGLKLARGSYAELDRILDELGVGRIDGILYDLGANSVHFDSAARGFSFQLDGPLKMLYEADSEEADAAALVNELPEEELARVIYEYGEERKSRRVARAIVEARRRRPLETTRELAEIVRRVVSRSPRRHRLDPATRTFQALRIACNRELEHLREGLPRGLARLKPGGVAVTIAFQSGEDRLCKMIFAQAAGRLTEIHQAPCEDEEFSGEYKLLTKKPLRPQEDEVRSNPRSRSARLRAIQRIND